MTQYQLTMDGEPIGTTTSERQARALARRHLGCDRLYETLTEDGVQWWPDADADSDGPSILVRYA